MAKFSEPLNKREADNVWEFPLLTRYRIPLRGIRPFAEAGWAPRNTHGDENVRGCYLNSQMTYTCYSTRSHTSWPVTHGAVVRAGLEFATGRALFAPVAKKIEGVTENSVALTSPAD